MKVKHKTWWGGRGNVRVRGKGKQMRIGKRERERKGNGEGGWKVYREKEENLKRKIRGKRMGKGYGYG